MQFLYITLGIGAHQSNEKEKKMMQTYASAISIINGFNAQITEYFNSVQS